jgi:hypothetical protein
MYKQPIRRKIRKSYVAARLSSLFIGVAGLLAALVMPMASVAYAVPSQVVVTPSNTQGWSTSDTRPGGAVNFVADSTAQGSPANGALQLTTDSTTASKAQYMLATDTPLSTVSELSYVTKQNSSPFAGADASYQLAMCMGGVSGSTCNNFTTLVYEPYENGTVTNGNWQSWDVMAGQVWSTRSVNNGSCQLTAGGGGAPFYTVAGLQSACPDAVVVSVGVNIGTNNPSYNVEADLVDFNGTTYNFEPFAAVTDKDACKNNGWMTAVDNQDNSFKNQGACVSFVEAGKN